MFPSKPVKEQQVQAKKPNRMANKPPEFRNGYRLTFATPFQFKPLQWVRIFMNGSKFYSPAPWIRFAFTLALSPIYIPSILITFCNVSTRTNCIQERCDFVSKWLYNFLNMWSITDYWKLCVGKLLSSVGLLSLVKKNDDLYITSYLGKFWGIQPGDRCYYDFNLFAKRMAGYFLHEFECRLRCEFPLWGSPARVKDVDGEPTKLYQPGETECRLAILHNLWGPMAHQCFEVAPGEWKIDFLPYERTHCWCSINCTGLRITYLPAKEKGLETTEQILGELSTLESINIEDWEIKVLLFSKEQKEHFELAESCAHNGTPLSHERKRSQVDSEENSRLFSDLYAYRCALQRIAVSLPTIWHSWIHFPTQDLIAVWVSKLQHWKRTDSVFFKIARTHTIGTKFNAQLVKELSRPLLTTFDPAHKLASNCVVLPSNRDASLTNIGNAFVLEQDKLKPATMGFPASLPFIKSMQEAWTAFEQFVDKIWPLIEKDATEFIKWVHVVTAGHIDFQQSLERKKGYIVRILWSQSLHWADHAFMTMNISKNPATFATLTPEMIEEDYLYGEQWEWISKKIKETQPKQNNFARMFSDYTYQTNTTPTVSDFDYGLESGHLKDLQEQLREGLKNAQEGFRRDANRIYAGYVDVERMLRNAPVSIDH